MKQLTEDPWINAIPENYQPTWSHKARSPRPTSGSVSFEDGRRACFTSPVRRSQSRKSSRRRQKWRVRGSQNFASRYRRTKDYFPSSGSKDNDTTAYDGSGPVGGDSNSASEFDEFAAPQRVAWTTTEPWVPTRSNSEPSAQFLYFNMVNFNGPLRGAFLCLKRWTSQHRQTKAAKVNKPIRLRWGVAAVNRYNKFMFMAGSFGGCTC